MWTCKSGSTKATRASFQLICKPCNGSPTSCITLGMQVQGDSLIKFEMNINDSRFVVAGYCCFNKWDMKRTTTKRLYGVKMCTKQCTEFKLGRGLPHYFIDSEKTCASTNLSLSVVGALYTKVH